MRYLLAGVGLLVLVVVGWFVVAVLPWAAIEALEHRPKKPERS